MPKQNSPEDPSAFSENVIVYKRLGEYGYLVSDPIGNWRPAGFKTPVVGRPFGRGMSLREVVDWLVKHNYELWEFVDFKEALRFLNQRMQ